MSAADIPCPNCGQPVQYDPKYAGETGSCPSCRKPFNMPATELELLRQIRNHTRDIRLLILIALTVQVIMFLLAFM